MTDPIPPMTSADIDSTAPGFDITVTARIILQPEFAEALAAYMLDADPELDVNDVMSKLMWEMVGGATRRCAHALTLPLQAVIPDPMSLPGVTYAVDGPGQHIGAVSTPPAP